MLLLLKHVCVNVSVSSGKGMLRISLFPLPGVSFPMTLSEFWSLFTTRISVGLKMTESLLCPADEVSRLEMGRLMRFPQSVRLAV